MSRARIVAWILVFLVLVAGVASVWRGDEPLPDGDPAGPDVLGFFESAARSDGTVTTLGLFSEAFTAAFEGRRDRDGTLWLDERFAFADGRRPLQRWHLWDAAAGRVAGTVETEDGEGRLAAPVAVEGRRTATGLVLAYEGFAPGGGGHRLHFRHEMRVLSAERVENHVTVRLAGLPLATADVLFVREGG